MNFQLFALNESISLSKYIGHSSSIEKKCQIGLSGAFPCLLLEFPKKVILPQGSLACLSYFQIFRNSLLDFVCAGPIKSIMPGPIRLNYQNKTNCNGEGFETNHSSGCNRQWGGSCFCFVTFSQKQTEAKQRLPKGLMLHKLFIGYFTRSQERR